MASESQIIERIRRRFPLAGKVLKLGIGDDAAVLRPSPGSEWIVTTDAFLEGVHFLRKVHPPDAVGYKALARATSDIAAMGAEARCFFLTLGLPDACAGPWLDPFVGGMARAARRFGLVLAGGDTTKYPTVVIALTVMGEVRRGRAISRSGAKPGDLLCVSGKLGEAEAGLRLILKNGPLKQAGRKELPSRAALLKRHFYPEPRLALGHWLASRRYATSMIDTSDGLSTDLGHLCSASGVGAVVWAEKLPVAAVPSELQRLGLDPLELALHGGEDYELLFTVPKRIASRLPQAAGGVPLTVIGEMTASRKIVLLEASGKRKLLRPGGWDPFRANTRR